MFGLFSDQLCGVEDKSGAQRYFQQLGFEATFAPPFFVGEETHFFDPMDTNKQRDTLIQCEAPKSENPADWIMDIIAGEVPNHRIPQFIPEMCHGESWTRGTDLHDVFGWFLDLDTMFSHVCFAAAFTQL